MAALTAHRPSANPMKSGKIRLNHSTCLFMSLPHVTLRARNGVPIPDRCCYQAFALINLLDYPFTTTGFDSTACIISINPGPRLQPVRCSDAEYSLAVRYFGDGVRFIRNRPVG